MPLSHEHIESKTLSVIKIYTLTRAELLCPLCYEIPGIVWHSTHNGVKNHSKVAYEHIRFHENCPEPTIYLKLEV